MIDWAAAYDLEKLWTEALNYHTLDNILDWYQYNDVTEFLRKCVAIQPDFVNDLLGNTTMTITEYLDEIKTHLGTSIFNELCAGLRETYFRPGTEYSLAEWHLYGSSRLGIYQANKQLATYYDSTLTTISYQTRIQYRTNGNRRFELSNHLGNVLVTVSDKRIPICTLSETVAYYKAEIITASDYYSFGSIMEGRYYKADSFGYRFSLNGQEKDDQIYGNGNTISTEFRQLDTRLGRWFSLDPEKSIYIAFSPFSAFGNNPILITDVNGDVLRVTSGAKEITKFTSLLNNKFAGAIQVEVKNGIVSLSGDASKLNTGQKALYDNLSKIIDHEKTTDVVLLSPYERSNATVGGWKGGQGTNPDGSTKDMNSIDVYDAEAIDNAGTLLSGAGAIIHEIEESFQLQVNGVDDYFAAHDLALAVQESVDGVSSLEIYSYDADGNGTKDHVIYNYKNPVFKMYVDFKVENKNITTANKGSGNMVPDGKGGIKNQGDFENKIEPKDNLGGGGDGADGIGR